MQTILVINAGSSSLKCTLFRTGQLQEKSIYRFKFSNLLLKPHLSIVDENGLDRVTKQPDFASVPKTERHHAALDLVLSWLNTHASQFKLTAFGHRIVHGGRQFNAPQILSKSDIAHLKELIPLAPLHQPYNLLLIDCCKKLAPNLPQIACFDTMFHHTQMDLERHYALPRQYTEAGIQRYGFHGLSYEYITHQLGQITPKACHIKTVICHLGAGSSMCAISQGKSIASSMGFTAVDGLPMGTRCGNIDPGVILYLQRHYNLDCDALEHLIYSESGWLGVSGESSDMLSLKRSQSTSAQEAIDMYAYRIALELGRLAAALGGLEQLVFTGGVGENDADLRQNIIERSRWLGIHLDEDANVLNASVISNKHSAIPVRVIATNEEAMIAHHVTEIIGD
jgi:acetate kinase